MLSALLTGTLLAGQGMVRANAHNFVTIPRASFRREGHPRIPELVAEVVAPRPFTEVIASWEATTPGGSWMEVTVQPDSTEGQAFVMAHWDESGERRSSIKDQKFEAGRVDTDTLVLAQATTRLIVRVKMQPGPADAVGDLKWLSLSLTRPEPGESPQRASRKSVWGTAMEPVRRAQNSYPGGNVLCSPTSVSMVLAYWASVTKDATIDADVPEVQAGVTDPAWGGTGNWSFNAAFATRRPNMRAYVTRLRDVRDLEEWIAAKVPVVTSISYALLKGEEKKRANDGHLVVLVGFAENGDPIFNDPGRAVVRMQYKRADFIKAWKNSDNTVYLIYPEGHNVPVGGPWADRGR